METIKFVLPVNPPQRKAVVYSAAFIHPAVHAVNLSTDDEWEFQVTEPIETEILTDGIKLLAERYAADQGITTDQVYSQEVTGTGKGQAEIDALFEEKKIVEIHQGLFVWREPLSLVIQFLDDTIVDRFATAFDAKAERYPNVIEINELGKTNHLSSFPEHLHFVSHLDSRLSVLDSYAQQSKEGVEKQAPEQLALNKANLVHNPSTCYHCYSAYKNTAFSEDTAYTAVTACHRYEGANHSDLGRLMEFSLREVIFIGSPDYVRKTRAKTLELMEDFAKDWKLGGSLQSENDPFFTSDFKVKAQHQRKMKMKYEYRAKIPGAATDLAIMSSNLHGLVFTKAFNLKSTSGPLHTGCLGFGVERLAIALIAQHGSQPENWPENLKNDWLKWNDKNAG